MGQKRSAFLRRCLDRAKSTPNIDTANATRSSIASQAGASKESRSSRESIKNSNTFPEPPWYLPTGTGHYTRNPDYFENLHLVGIFLGVPDMNKETTGYIAEGPIQKREKTLG